MSRGPQKHVNPKVAAVVLIAVLGGVQWFWWRGLLSKPPTVETRQQGGGPMPAGPQSVLGDPSLEVDTLAGAPDPGNADGPGHRARFDTPVGIAVGPDGDVFVADSRNHRIRRITPAGKVSTLAGSVSGAADGPAAQATFQLPSGVAVGPDGAVYVADSANHRIRRILNGQVTTLAGGTEGMADGKGAAAKFDTPCGIAYAGGALLVADTGNGRIRRVALDGTVGGGWAAGGAPTGVTAGMAVGTAGMSAPGAPPQNGLPIEGSDNLTLRHPVGVCPAPGGGWLVTDTGHCGVFRVQGGRATLIAGVCPPKILLPQWIDDAGHRARFAHVGGLATDGKGIVYVCDTGNNAIRRIQPGGERERREEEAP